MLHVHIPTLLFSRRVLAYLLTCSSTHVKFNDYLHFPTERRATAALGFTVCGPSLLELCCVEPRPMCDAPPPRITLHSSPAARAEADPPGLSGQVT